jgi:hypothetical protein
MSTKKIEEKIATLELFRAAYHELSHAAVARHFGAYSEVTIWRNVGNAERNETAWLSECQHFDQRKLLTKGHRQLIAMAGIIGEELAVAKRERQAAEE